VGDRPAKQGAAHVYLLHFSRPLRHARHYIGQTTRADVMERIAEHRAGRGARITREAVAAGIELIVARVWADAPRRYERFLKKQGGARRICPVCKAEAEAAKGSMK